MRKVVFVLVSLLAVACNSTPSKNNSAAAQAGAKQDTQAVAAGASQDHAANADAFAGHGVYFDTDKFAVASAYGPLLKKEAEYINSQKKAVTLEGNCDERGSDEYNLALGQRRADAVKKLLVAAGVNAHQVKTVSLGRDKPKATCHDESCWKENRRVDFVQG